MNTHRDWLGIGILVQKTVRLLEFKNRLILIAFMTFSPVSFAQDPSSDCLAALEKNPEISELLLKVPADVTQGQSLEVLSNPTTPTENEKKALSFMVTEGDKCHRMGEAWRYQNYPAEINALLTTFRADAVAAFADLFVGKINFGELAKFRAKSTAEMISKATIVMAQVNSKKNLEQRQRQDIAANEAQTDRRDRERQLERQREAELRAEQQREEGRRQALVQYFMNQRPVYQLPVPMPIFRHPETTCNLFGNQMRCTTR